MGLAVEGEICGGETRGRLGVVYWQQEGVGDKHGLAAVVVLVDGCGKKPIRPEED